MGGVLATVYYSNVAELCSVYFYVQQERWQIMNTTRDMFATMNRVIIHKAMQKGWNVQFCEGHWLAENYKTGEMVHLSGEIETVTGAISKLPDLRGKEND